MPCQAFRGARTALRVLRRLPREEPFQLEGYLGDGLEDPVAVAAVLEVVAEVPIHRLPEGRGGQPPDRLTTDDGEGSAGGRDVDQDGRGALVLGEIPLLEEGLGAGLGVFARPLVNGEADARPGVPARLG